LRHRLFALEHAKHPVGGNVRSVDLGIGVPGGQVHCGAIEHAAVHRD
jgi:hypothetical protein